MKIELYMIESSRGCSSCNEKNGYQYFFYTTEESAFEALYSISGDHTDYHNELHLYKFEAERIEDKICIDMDGYNITINWNEYETDIIFSPSNDDILDLIRRYKGTHITKK